MSESPWQEGLLADPNGSLQGVPVLYQLRKRLPEPLRELLRRIRAVFLSLGLPHEGEFLQPEVEKKATADMSIIIAVLDPPQLRRCLASVERYAPQAEVILVDDGSVLEQTQDIIRAFISRNGWKLVRHRCSEGHSKACEAGARLASRPYLCFLNSDTVVTPWSWRAAQEAFEADPEIAITGPTTSHATTAQMVKRAELCRHYWTDVQVFGFAKRYITGLSTRAWVDLPEVGGFAFFIRQNVWQEFGGFDPNLPDYGNEVELCRRVSKQGWRIVWTRNSYVHHLGNQVYSASQFGPDFISVRSLRALEYIRRKHG